MNSKPVIVRTQNAGVHFGYLVGKSPTDVKLINSRRIWRWFGAFTLSEISQAGLDISRSKVAVSVPEIELNQWIEIIPCSPEAEQILLKAAWNE